MKQRLSYYAVLLVLAGAVYAPYSRADDAAGMTAMLLVKLAAFDLALDQGEVTVYVMGAPDVAERLNRLVGTRMHGGILTAVETGSGIPASRPSVFFIGREGEVRNALEYTRAHDVLSISAQLEHVRQGATLGITMHDGGPAVFLNLEGSRLEKRNWHPGIMKLAKTVF